MFVSRIDSRVRSIVVVACVIAAAGRPAAAQNVLQFDSWMQKIDRRSQSVQRNIAQRNSAAASVDARELGELYRLMQNYFAQRGDAGAAAKLASEGGALIESVLESLQSNDLDAASRSASSVAQACRECHIKYKPAPGCALRTLLTCAPDPAVRARLLPRTPGRLQGKPERPGVSPAAHYGAGERARRHRLGSKSESLMSLCEVSTGWVNDRNGVETTHWRNRCHQSNANTQKIGYA